MPELPEVETVRRSLEKTVCGKTIQAVTLRYEKIVYPETQQSLNHALKNRSIQAVHRRGKYLLFDLQTVTMMIHLRMEGRFYIKDANAPFEKHEHVVFYLDNGMSLRYHDTRKFGTITLKPQNELYTTPPLSKLGPEPGEERLNRKYLKEKLQTTRAIKTALLDQTIIAGLGNIYVDEVLFCATINPETKANTLKNRDIEAIIDCSTKVIAKAVTLGGSSIRTYTDTLGISGRFQNELQVHMRADEPCHVCHTEITKIKVGGRGTYYCPTCQRAFI